MTRGGHYRHRWPLVDVLLALELFFSDAVCFIPVQLGEPKPAVLQPNACDPFHPPPAAFPIQASQPRQLANTLADMRFCEYLEDKLKSLHPMIDEEMETDGTDIFVNKYGSLINASRALRTRES
jgi:hypothetical protein